MTTEHRIQGVAPAEPAPTRLWDDPPDLPPDLVRRTEAEHRADVDRLLRDRPEGPLWLFAYGSLLWKPATEIAEERPAVASGWRRSFCMRIHSHRGTPERPGLMMALDRGGQCRGIVQRLRDAHLEDDLFRLLLREMPVRRVDDVPFHRARWIPVRAGGERMSALAFVMHRESPHYEGRLTAEETADILAAARGFAGSCADYLFNTVAALESRGIRDRNLLRLERLVAERLKAASWFPAQSRTSDEDATQLRPSVSVARRRAAPGSV